VPASEVIEMINAGKNVTFSNVTVVGDLDFTQLDNMRETNTGNPKSYRSTVDVGVSFRNCNFKGKVLGYVNSGNDNWIKQDEPVYHADFAGDAAFIDCIFEDDVFFKYTSFFANASFRGSAFGEEALFKYTKFDEYVDFSATRFLGTANFKYTKLTSGVTFAAAEFRGDATFKYTELRREVSFAGANFYDSANFKYVKFPTGTNLTNTSFGENTDFKYTTLGGKPIRR